MRDGCNGVAGDRRRRLTARASRGVEGRGEDAGRLLVTIGTPLAEVDEAGLRRRLAEMVAEFQGMRMRDIALGRLLLEAASVAADHHLRMPRELAILSKTLLNVDEVTRQLDPEFDPNAAIRRNASAILTQRMLRSLSPGRLFAGLLEFREFAEKLPARKDRLQSVQKHLLPDSRPRHR